MNDEQFADDLIHAIDHLSAQIQRSADMIKHSTDMNSELFLRLCDQLQRFENALRELIEEVEEQKRLTVKH
jgi:hypothetical protein